MVVDLSRPGGSEILSRAISLEREDHEASHTWGFFGWCARALALLLELLEAHMVDAADTDEDMLSASIS
jgi:hypothetical protein